MCGSTLNHALRPTLASCKGSLLANDLLLVRLHNVSTLDERVVIATSYWFKWILGKVL